MAGALIVTAELGAEDLAWLDAQRRAHFPPERNVLKAHLTLFHALPPSSEDEVRRALKAETATAPPSAAIVGVLNLGKGSAWRIGSPGLDAIRAALADRFDGLLSAQDRSGFRAHVTIQNKVAPADARALQADMVTLTLPRAVRITGLGLHRYLDGPWESLAQFPFREGRR